VSSHSAMELFNSRNHPNILSSASLSYLHAQLIVEFVSSLTIRSLDLNQKSNSLTIAFLYLQSTIANLYLELMSAINQYSSADQAW